MAVQAVAAEAAGTMRVVQAASLSEAELQECTARPRIDFTSILGTVSRCWGHKQQAAVGSEVECGLLH